MLRNICMCVYMQTFPTPDVRIYLSVMCVASSRPAALLGGWYPVAQISGEEKPGITHPDSHIWRYFLCPLCLRSAPENRPTQILLWREGVMLIAVVKCSYL